MRHRGFVRHIAPFAALSVIVSGITPSLAVMVLLIALCALLRFRFAAPLTGHASGSTSLKTEARDRGAQVSSGRNSVQSLSTSYVAWGAASLIFLTAVSFVVFGFLTRGSDFPANGYMDYSMNLLSPINPSNSTLLPTSFFVMRSQTYEGYNYLGAGVILAGLLCLARQPALIAKGVANNATKKRTTKALAIRLPVICRFHPSMRS
jgi:hypothetical protein